MKIFFATQNEGKLWEAGRILGPLGIEVVPVPVELSEPDAGTMEEVARIKLKQVMERGMTRVMVDDAGIYFAAYPQFPGVLTKRVFHRIGYRGVAKLLAGESREAWFEGTVAVCWDGQIRTFSGVTRGRIIESISEKIRPEPGFPFDPIFVPEGEHRALNEMPVEDRLRYSYRRKALEKMAEWMRMVSAKDSQ
ncbi:non-canonical purine NTP pyrophosphatase [Lihuaxuella thermophila]|uniref:XTP/dITP diphosphohydrolase n=1 Tax=Lihuaxuella thermophila TaxID=1173111 RepID=A0A1H8GVX1_9BACL|nr:non-canonical purine NTP pyrophosphatase [Lihuaxuella thermophila]SEN47960.1 XTP/dITP diphosphohydrolase [Lihuaxuella thermophila]